MANISTVPAVHHGFHKESYSIPSYFMTTDCFIWNLECTLHSWITVWVKVHQLKNLWGQAVCSPHHLDSARGGQGRPPRRECFSTCRLLVDSPIPQDRLHGDQDPHSPTWHGTARPVGRKSIYSFHVSNWLVNVFPKKTLDNLKKYPVTISKTAYLVRYILAQWIEYILCDIYVKFQKKRWNSIIIYLQKIWREGAN